MYCCFEWHNLFFCTILWQFTVNVNVFPGFFFHKQKGIRVFQWQEDTNVIVIIALSSFMSQFFEILIFRQDIWEMFIMSMKSTSFLKELWWKPFISQVKQIKRNLRQFCRWKTTEGDDAKINIFLSRVLTKMRKELKQSKLI